MKCDGCTLCCELLNVPWMDSPSYELCKHCNDNGCDIYDTAPKDCLDFFCAYTQMDKASIDLRPDKCGVIFEKITNKLFIGTIDPEQKGPADIVLKQISAFLNDGYSTILYHKKIKEPMIFNTKDRTKKSVWFELQVVEADKEQRRKGK